MSSKLTPRMVEALARMDRREKRSSYELRANLGTLEALEQRGLVRAYRGLGSIAMPHTSIRWWLTDAGEKANEAVAKENGYVTQKEKDARAYQTLEQDPEYYQAQKFFSWFPNWQGVLYFCILLWLLMLWKHPS